MKKVRLDPAPFVLPMPTVLVGAVVGGKPNFMTAAFAGIINLKPVIVALGIGPSKHTAAGIDANNAFSINLPGPELVEQTDWCGINTGKKADKSGVFELFAGTVENAPMIKACKLTAECRLIKTVEFPTDNVYFGEVENVYVDENALNDGSPDWLAISPLIFTFPDKGYWKLGPRIAEAWHVGRGYKPAT